MTNASSFDHILDWKQVFLTKSQPKNPETFPFVIIGNKVDLADARKVATNNAKRVCEENRELKERLEKITRELFVVYCTAKKVLGGEDASGTE